jgi:hypothetical protein
MKHEFITPNELKKLMKLSISIKIELGFYVSLTGNYIDIDRYENLCPKNVQTFYFKDEDLEPILKRVSAYSRLFKHKLSMR